MDLRDEYVRLFNHVKMLGNRTQPERIYCIAFTLAYDQTVTLTNQLYLVDTLYELVESHDKKVDESVFTQLVLIQNELTKLLGISTEYQYRDLTFNF